MLPLLRRAALLGTVLGLAVAAPASAATIQVRTDGSDACTSGGSQPCRTVTRAESIAGAGDTIDVGAGVFLEPAPVVVDVADVDIRGAGIGTVIVTDPANAGGPAIAFARDGALADALVLKSAGSGAAVATEASLDLDRVHALSLVGTALAVVSPGSGDGTGNVVTADSSVFSGSQGQYGVTVVSEANALLPPGSADDVAVTLRHVTVAGAGAKGILLDASAADGGPCPLSCVPAGSLTATLTDSIVDGASTTVANPGGGLAAANTAELGFTGHNLADPVDGGAPTGGGVDAAALFWDPQGHILRLRPGAGAAIDTGSAEPATGEPALDLFGDPRRIGAATDLGADEYVNAPPTAALRASTDNPLVGETVTFEATGHDPEAGVGGGIATYYWSFGDGSHAITQTATVTHAYSAQGDKDVTLAVEDAEGALSEIVARRIVVSPATDRAAPEVRILQPESGQVLSLRGKRRAGTRRRRPLQLSILGGVQDTTGIRRVEVALRLVKRRRGARPGGGRCEYYAGRRRFSTVGCADPVWLKAKRTRNVWRLRTPKGWRVPPGRYQVRVRGTDVLGNVSTGFDRAARTLVAFRVR